MSLNVSITLTHGTGDLAHAFRAICVVADRDIDKLVPFADGPLLGVLAAWRGSCDSRTMSHSPIADCDPPAPPAELALAMKRVLRKLCDHGALSSRTGTPAALQPGDDEYLRRLYGDDDKASVVVIPR